MMTSYNLYGHLLVRLDTDHKGYRKYFDNEYARISRSEAAGEDASRITVAIVSELPAAEPGDIRRVVRFKKLFTFQYVVRGLESRDVTIYFKRHWVDRVYMNAIGVYLQAQVLEPLMYFKLLQENILFMHAGGVTKDDMGILLPAYGGTGKTTLSMALLNQGHKLLGDDLLLVDVASGIVHPYPRPLHIFTYNVRNLRGAKIPFKYTFAVYFKNVLRYPLERILRTEFLISTRIHADELFEGDIFGTSSPYGAIAFLRKQGPAAEIVEITQSNVDEIADGIAESADLNDSLNELLQGEPALWSEAQRLEHETIVALLRSRGVIAYVNTRAMDLDNLENFSETILPVAQA
ncbi:hypothetical protein ASC66_09430 [Leifsonia sp. Root4]|uniref:hypothetical protein n=1 Tax=Leifsonia sp. Root4 TaxID=1736525 RepID=UPI0006F65131|nr:hypothetical protein [Leifsonia sp. Root4]KQW06665.1 hypothetical protein ASC66_09430 [Leifsonia sp. Root4]